MLNSHSSDLLLSPKNLQVLLHKFGESDIILAVSLRMSGGVRRYGLTLISLNQIRLQFLEHVIGNFSFAWHEKEDVSLELLVGKVFVHLV